MGIISFLTRLFENPEDRIKRENYVPMVSYYDQTYGVNAVLERHRRDVERQAREKGLTAEEYLLARIEKRNKWREYQAYKRELMKDLPEKPTDEEEKKFYDLLWEKKCELMPEYADQKRWHYKTEIDPDESEPSKFDPENFIEYVREHSQK